MIRFELRHPAGEYCRLHPAAFDSQVEKWIKFMLPFNIIAEARIVSVEVSRDRTEALIQFETDSEELISLIKQGVINGEELLSFDFSNMFGAAVMRGLSASSGDS